MNHKFHPSILRAYDIRGVYNQTLFDNDAYFVGKCFAYILKRFGKNKMAVACDGRMSSPTLKERLIQGLCESGISVIDVGLGPTPMLYFSVYELDLDAGIMVTGSHNPKDHNGFKMMIKGQNFHGENILELAKILENHDFISGDGSLSYFDIKEKYVERLVVDCAILQSPSELLNELDNPILKKKLKIAWDCGNGSAGEIATMLSKRIFGEHILLFNDIDGNFPNHHPDPTEAKNLQDLIAVVKEQKCDFGIAFDGDGDRIGVVDGEGEIIWGDQLLIFYARDILQKNPGATIIADVKASATLFKEITHANGVAVMWKTGHSLIKAKMKELKASLAGEMSGHIFFADNYYGFDDALYASIRLINILATSSQNLATMRASLPKSYATPEIRIETSEDQKFKIVDNLKELLLQNNENFIDIDGIRAFNDKGWWLIRASNTQSVLVARCEANSPENLDEIKANLRQKLDFCNIKIPHEIQ
ncbi:MAG: phosphomannomutase/phosphoglucomutase [Proteobacteria bacterium]|nr:phosphomannomutase/phosphoglucomutase [Pseudomonadota bacterium]NCA28535.1 phosphomannomutase/phosphoglucomutase [Pseudomonadota bacterium]